MLPIAIQTLMRYRAGEKPNGTSSPPPPFLWKPLPLPDRDPPPTPAWTVLSVVAVAAIPASMFGNYVLAVSLHDEVVRRARHREFIRTVIHGRHDARKIVMRRRRRNRPLERRGFPGVVSGRRAFEHAPEEIEIEEDLSHDSNDRRHSHKQHQPM